MYEIYDDWPKLAKQTYEKIKHAIEFRDIDSIIFAGMGGSGAAGEIFASVLSKSDIHVSVIKGYVLPNPVNSNTLVVTVSVSGNSVEPLTILEKAKKKNAKTIAFSSGGKMEEYCTKNKVLHHKFKMVHSPRASLPIVFYSMLGLLGNNLGIKKAEIPESIKQLQITSKNINSQSISSTKNKARSLGMWIKNIPIIYYPYGLYPAALRFKNSLQENCKLHATTEDVVEACHNNIVAWERKTAAQPILIRGIDDHPKTKERWDILKSYFNENNIEFKEIHSVSGGIISKLINLIYVLDYATIYHAVANGIDPTPIRSIDYVKARLSPSV